MRAWCYFKQTNFKFKKNVCLRCLDELTKLKEQENEKIKKKIDTYRSGIADLLSEINSNQVEDSVEQDIKMMQAEEKKIDEELTNMTIKEENLSERIRVVVEQINQLSKKEETLWKDFSAVENDLVKSEKEKDQLKVETTVLETELKNHFRSFIVDDLFNISISDHVGLVNGLRLGVLKGVLP